MTEKEILKILYAFDSFLTRANPIWDGLREIGMAIAKGLAGILDGVSGVLGNLIKLLDIGNSPLLADFITKLDPLKWGLLTLALIGFFVLLMFNKIKSPGETPMNLLLVIVLTISLPFLFTTTSTMVQGVFKGVNANVEKPGTAIILDNTTDLRAVAEEGWKLKEGESLNHYNSERQVNMSEKLTEPKKIKNGDPLKSYIFTSNDGKDSPQDIPAPEGVAGWLGDMFATNYYRNNVKFLQVYLTMIVSIIAMTITSFKFAIIINKMYGDYVLLITASTADIVGLQRVKAIFSELVGSFALIVYVPILYQVYLISVTVIKSFNFDFWTYIVAMAGAAWALMDGPNGFAKVTGIDAGLKSTAAVVAGALGGSKLAQMGSKAVGNVAKSAAGALSDVGAFGAGFTADAMTDTSGKGKEGINREEKDSEKDRNGTENEDGLDKGINETNNPNDNDQSPTEGENEGTENDSLNNGSPTEGQDSQGDSQSLEDTEPPGGEDSGDADSTQSINSDPAQPDKDGTNDQARKPEGVNESVEEKSAQPDQKSEALNDSPQADNDAIDNQISQKEKELSNLNKNNPLRNHAKNRTIGYGQNDQRRYQRMNRLEKTSESFNAGANYRQFRQQKKSLQREIKELKGKKNE